MKILRDCKKYVKPITDIHGKVTETRKQTSLKYVIMI
jgi:hypothetical protein